MKRLILALVLVATPACAQSPQSSCEEELTALSRSFNLMIEASRQAQGSAAQIKKLQAELDKLKAPSTPKAPSKPEAPGQ